MNAENTLLFAYRNVYCCCEQVVEHWIVGDQRQQLLRLFIRPSCSADFMENDSIQKSSSKYTCYICMFHIPEPDVEL